MPIKYRKKIVKKRVTRKPYKKNNKKSLVQLIKKVSLKQSETKHTVYLQENIQLNHNSNAVIGSVLATTQSVSDLSNSTNNTACRIGDQVKAVGVSFKFWFANKLDRPNVMYRLTFFYYQSSQTAGDPMPFYTQSNTNLMIRDLDTEKFKIIKAFRFNLQHAAQRIITVGGALVGAEGHRFISVYLPMRLKTISYEDGSSRPRFLDIGYSIVAYDSAGTSTADQIASYAVTRKFYFKDP